MWHGLSLPHFPTVPSLYFLWLSKNRAEPGVLESELKSQLCQGLPECLLTSPFLPNLGVVIAKWGGERALDQIPCDSMILSRIRGKKQRGGLSRRPTGWSLLRQRSGEDEKSMKIQQSQTRAPPWGNIRKGIRITKRMSPWPNPTLCKKPFFVPTHTCTCTYTQYTCTHVHTHTCIHMNMHAYTYSHVCACIHTHVHTCTHTHCCYLPSEISFNCLCLVCRWLFLCYLPVRLAAA